MDEGSYSSLEEKRVVLENRLDRSVMTRIIFSTEDRQFLAQVLREITFSIEVTTVMSLYCPIDQITIPAHLILRSRFLSYPINKVTR